MAVLSVFSAGAAEATTENIANDSKIYFEFPAEIWKNYNLKINKRNFTNVFAYVSEIYGDAEYPKTNSTTSIWQMNAKDNDPNTLVFYYDFAGKIAQNNDLMIKEDADYTIQFYHNGYETFALTFDTSRLGDTVVVTPALLENPQNSRKTQYAAYWKSEMNKAQKDREYGPALTVTSFGRVVGEKYSKYQPKAQKLSVALHDYLLNKDYTNAFTTEKISKICDKLGLSAQEVYFLYSEDYKEELDKGLETTPSLKLVAECLRLLPTIIKGDIDGNGALTINDITMFQRYLAEMILLDSNQLAAADVNDDGYVNIKDLTELQRVVSEF